MTEKDTLSKFGTNFQTKTLSCLVSDKQFAERMMDILDPQYYDQEANRWTCKKIRQYWNKYRDTPTMDFFKTELSKEDDDEARKSKVRTLRQVFKGTAASDLEYVKDEFLEFSKNQAMKVAILDSVDLMKLGNYDAIRSKIDDALNAGMDKSVGHIYTRDFEDRMKDSARNTVPTPFEVLNDVMDGGLGKGELGSFVGASGCHAKGTMIMMYDGSQKAVEDVQVGDLLMGPDSTSRRVMRLCRGSQTMYRIVPTKGKPFVVNGDHVLSLKRTTRRYPNRHGEIVNIKVEDYANKSRSFKAKHKLYKTTVESFENTEEYEYAVDPYFVGLLVGDGSMSGNQFSITTADDAIRDYVLSETKASHKMSVPHKDDRSGNHCIQITNDYNGNPVLDEMKLLELRGKNSKTKFVPEKFKFGSIKVRQQFLAGLLDADGSLNNNGYDYVTASDQLAKDVQFVARSLGLSAYISEKEVNGSTYYRMYISGEAAQIPCKLERKKASPRKQVKDVKHFGFEVEKLEEDDYYGFTLNKDHLYLDGEFTVHHNSGKTWMLAALGLAALKRGKMVAHYTLELSEEQTGLRYDSLLSQRSPTDVKKEKGKVKKLVEQIKKNKGELAIQEWPARSASVQSIRSHVSRLELLHRKPDVILVDYADLLRTVNGNSYDGNSYERAGQIYVELRALASELQLPIWTVSQANREGNSSEIIGAELIADSYQKVMHCDFMGSISRTADDKEMNTGRIHLIKNRFGPDGMTYPSVFDPENGRIRVFENNSQQSDEMMRDMEVRRQQNEDRRIGQLANEFLNNGGRLNGNGQSISL